MLVVSAVAAGAGFGASLGVAHGQGNDSAKEAAVKQVFLEAQVLGENEGAPAPAGLAKSADWAVHGDSLVHTKNGDRLENPGHSWVDDSGHVLGLSAAEVAQITSQQDAEADAILAPGKIRTNYLNAINGWAKKGGELVSSMSPADAVSAINSVGPVGGAEVVKWESIDIAGTTASVHAVMKIWNENDQATLDGQGNLHVATEVASGYGDSYATLQETPSGTWQIVSMDTEPSDANGNTDVASG